MLTTQSSCPQHTKMRLIASVIVSIAHLIVASPTVFSVHDDLLAFPQVSSCLPRSALVSRLTSLQYEVVFSENSISNSEASLLISQSSPISHNTPTASAVISLPPVDDNSETPSASLETYELLHLDDVAYLCNIPIIETPSRNETSEREARAAERQEMARATDRGWELLQELEGNCLYLVSGWWSYSFCHNHEVIQFHQLAPQPGTEEPAKRDPNTKQFVLGKAANREDNLSQPKKKVGKQMDLQKKNQVSKSELQVKGGIRYLVQRMDGGTICDLTGRPRKIEVQFHCNPSVMDRIGYIKEITTCSYLMVIYTPRLCSDPAFLPPKENKVNLINCRAIVPEKDDSDLDEVQTLERNIKTSSPQVAEEKEAPKIIGGILLGGRKWINIENQHMPVPEDLDEEIFQDEDDQVVEIIARAKNKARGEQVEVANAADLKKLDLDPDLIEALRIEVQNIVREKGWKIEIVDTPGQAGDILSIVEEDENVVKGNEGKEKDRSEETLNKDEL